MSTVMSMYKQLLIIMSIVIRLHEYITFINVLKVPYEFWVYGKC